MFFIFYLTSFAKNPLDAYISDDVYKESLKKFQGKNNYFKELIVDKTVVEQRVIQTTGRISSTFKKIDTIIKKGDTWGGILYYTENGIEKRKVIFGNTSIKVGDYRYYLQPHEKGVVITDISSGKVLKLNAQEGR
ncbi:MAG: hypothetical protein PWP46_1533 [Fusobacteriaceae bacterium]|jgi:hypothetical protein|nr:hypothetical protein [Fusobacteriaceae bacterium]